MELLCCTWDTAKKKYPPPILMSLVCWFIKMSEWEEKRNYLKLQLVVVHLIIDVYFLVFKSNSQNKACQEREECIPARRLLCEKINIKKHLFVSWYASYKAINIRICIISHFCHQRTLPRPLTVNVWRSERQKKNKIVVLEFKCIEQHVGSW